VLDTRGATLRRTISDGGGRFAITLGSGAARLHLIRIGFRPRDIALPARLDVPLELGMLRFPAVLSAVHVSDQELCPGSPDRGAAFQLWEEARAGLLATVVARETNPAMAHFVRYDRHLSPDDDRVVTQTTHALSGVTTRPFVASEPAAIFARAGYMHQSGNDRVFEAPDADVLLDESFAASHCFHLQRPDADHRGQAGLAFRPLQIRGRDTLVDVAGVIWIDETTPELRSLDFTYTALEPAAMRAGTGGQIQFHTMPNGIAFVERWHLRLPALAAPEPPVRHDPYTAELVQPPRRRQERYDLQVAEVVEAGAWCSTHDGPTAKAGTSRRRLSRVSWRKHIVRMPELRTRSSCCRELPTRLLAIPQATFASIP